MSETIIQTPVSLKNFDKKCVNPQVPQEVEIQKRRVYKI